MNLNTVRIYVRDIERAKVFYANALGLKLKVDGAARGHCIFDAGNCELLIEAVPTDASPQAQALVGRVTGLSFQVPNVHMAYNEFKAKGVEFIVPPRLQFWGGTAATLRDPEGNELQLVHRPAA
jgi:catechol 2,3-dioxygenase-like lactoylglutathione lyase family enzyme